MSDMNDQEKTERATPKRLRDAQSQGQVVRSFDLNTMFIVLLGSAGILMFAQRLIECMCLIANHSFSLTRGNIFDPNQILNLLYRGSIDAIFALSPLLFVLVIAALLGPIILNGWTISYLRLIPKSDRLNPIRGLQRIFTLRSLLELVKAVIKFSLVATIVFLFIWWQLPTLLTLNQLSLLSGLQQGLQLLAWDFIIISMSLIVIAVIDLPYQLWDHARQLRMTKQEVKDEHQETEGDPEIKIRIHKMQQTFRKV